MSGRVCVVGAGQMGSGIAQVAAVAGYDVTLVDVSRDQLDRARSSIERSLAKLVEKGSVESGAAEAALARITPAGQPVEADLAIAAATEDVALNTTSLLGIDPDRVNVNGGAVALGHPIGASGARLLGTVIHELRRRGGGIGVAAICSGAAQGDATVLEVMAA